MSEQKTKRAERRRRSRLVSLRRLKSHLRGGGHDVDSVFPRCWCKCPGEASVFYYSKRSVACSCSKRLKGSPRLSSGMCDPDARKRVYKWRKETRELNRLVCHQNQDPEEDALAVLS